MNMNTTHLAHDLFLLMLNLAQFKSRERILDVFLGAMNDLHPGLSFEFLADEAGRESGELKVATAGVSPPSILPKGREVGPLSSPRTEASGSLLRGGEGLEVGSSQAEKSEGSDPDTSVITIATTQYTFGWIVVQGDQSELQQEFLMLVRNAVRMLALILENLTQAQLLAEEKLKAEEIVQERTAKLVAANKQLKREMTRRERIEAEREALIQELEAKNAELEQFTYTVSHDLKSPLVTVSGFLALLQKDVARGNLEQIQSDIMHITDATKKMRQLLDELLALSRIGRMINPPEPAPMVALTRDAVDMLAGQLELQGIQVKIAENLPVVYGDRVRLRQVLQNLISNAVKFMGDQPNPYIEMGVREGDNGPILYVRDNGIGIDPRYHQKIFGLFEKLDPATEGCGAGLAIAKRIVEAHGGRIWVESEGQGLGSTFCFTLPERSTPLKKEQ